MSQFSYSVLTDIGWDTLSAALAGGKLSFLTMEAGDGPAATDAQMEAMTALQQYIMDIPITSYSDDGKGQLTLVGTLSSKFVATGFWFRELGVKANIDDGTEVLYCVCNCGALADWIPPSSDPTVVTQTLEIIVKIDRAANVVVNVVSGIETVAQNIGPATIGAGWYRDKIADTLYFKRFVNTPSIIVAETTDTVKAEVNPDALMGIVPIGGMIGFGGDVAPLGWLLCDGAFYDPAVYPELYSELGYKYGQSGNLFAVPDARGRVAIGAGQGQGLTNRLLGQKGGAEVHYLTIAEMPSHAHSQPAHTHYIHDPTHAHSIADWTHSHGFADPGHAHGVYDPGHGHHFWGQWDRWNTNDGSFGGRWNSGSIAMGLPSGPPSNFPVWELWGPLWDWGNPGYGSPVYRMGANIGIYGAGTGCWIWGAYSNIGCYGAYTGVYNAWAGNEDTYGTGGSQPHNNMPPYVVMHKIIRAV